MKLPFFPARPDEDPILEAIDLRERYGAEAEQWCESGILAADRPSQRRSLYRIREALRVVPAEEFAA